VSTDAGDFVASADNPGSVLVNVKSVTTAAWGRRNRQNGHGPQLIHFDLYVKARSAGLPLSEEQTQFASAAVRERAQHTDCNGTRGELMHHIMDALVERGHERGQSLGFADSNVQRRRMAGGDAAVRPPSRTVPARAALRNPQKGRIRVRRGDAALTVWQRAADRVVRLRRASEARLLDSPRPDLLHAVTEGREGVENDNTPVSLSVMAGRGKRPRTASTNAGAGSDVSRISPVGPPGPWSQTRRWERPIRPVRRLRGRTH